MTTNEIAELLSAKKVGMGRWQARCPAHKDSSPSLSIREGRDGRVLLKCFACCTTPEVVQALGLRMADLFSGAPLTQQERDEMAAQREAQADEDRRRRRWLIEPYDDARKANAIADALLDRLVNEPSAATATAYHFWLDEMRMWDAEAQRREAQAKETNDVLTKA